MSERLRLKAIDPDDLQVLAACLQDALIPLREMAFMAKDRRFMAAFDRFQWERPGTPDGDDKAGAPDGGDKSGTPDGEDKSGTPDSDDKTGTPDGDGKLTLCQSALQVEHVLEVKYRGLDRDLDGVKLELLTIVLEPAEAGTLDLVLLFAGDMAIKLRVKELCLTLEDFGEPRVSNIMPRHDLPDMPQGTD